MIEKNFDILFIADRTLPEKQIQQNYRPIIVVRKWFAKRPEIIRIETLGLDRDKR